MDPQFHPMINVRTSSVTMRQVVHFIESMNQKYPGRSYFLDGDTYCIGYREKSC